jgi:hypothetical protein
MTNPASGQVLTITGPGAVGLGSSTSIISDSIANKTEATTTNITIDQTTEIAQIEVSQSLGAYAPNSLPPQASSGTGGPVIGSGTGPGTGTGTGTGTGSDGTDGTDEGTDGTDETGTTTGSIIIGGTGLGPGSPGTSGG